MAVAAGLIRMFDARSAAASLLASSSKLLPSAACLKPDGAAAARARGHKERASNLWMLGGHEPRNHTLAIRSSASSCLSAFSSYITPYTPVFDIHIVTTLKVVRVLTAKVQSFQRNESQRAWRPWHSSTKPQERGSARESLSTEIEHRHTHYQATTTSAQLSLRDYSSAPAPCASCHDCTAGLRLSRPPGCFALRQSIPCCRFP